MAAALPGATHSGMELKVTLNPDATIAWSDTNCRSRDGPTEANCMAGRAPHSATEDVPVDSLRVRASNTQATARCVWVENVVKEAMTRLTLSTASTRQPQFRLLGYGEPGEPTLSVPRQG